MKRKLLLSLSAMFLMAASSFAQADCANAVQATLCTPLLDTGSTIGGIAPTFATCTTGVGTGGAHWYVIVGDGGNWDVNTDSPNSNYDTRIHVFSGTCAALTCVDGNDDGAGTVNGGLLSIVPTFTTTIGVNYYIIVGGFGSSEGTYELSVTSDAVCTGVNSVTSNIVASISPNPTNNFVNVDLGNITGAINYSLYTIDGRLVKEEKTVSTNNFKVDLTNENNGIYFLRIRDESNSVKTYKVIKK